MTWDVLEKLDDQTDVFYYVTQSIIMQPKRDHIVIRLVHLFFRAVTIATVQRILLKQANDVTVVLSISGQQLHPRACAYAQGFL